VEIKHNKSQPDASSDRQSILKIVKGGAPVSTVNARKNPKVDTRKTLAKVSKTQLPTLTSRVQFPSQLEIEFPAQPAIKVTRCPKCQSRNRTRISRIWWMRLLPGSRYYQCYSCYQPYLKWCGKPIAH